MHVELNVNIQVILLKICIATYVKKIQFDDYTIIIVINEEIE